MSIFLGDIVDSCSDENVQFALELMSKLKSPYYITPGNHDFEMYEYRDEKITGPFNASEKKQQAKQIWRKYNITFAIPIKVTSNW